MGRADLTKGERAQRDIDMFTAVFCVYAHDNPLQDMVLLVTRSCVSRSGYASVKEIIRIFDYPERGLRIILGRLKAQGLIVMNEEGYMRVTGKGSVELGKIHGDRARLHEGIEKGRVEKKTEINRQNIKAYNERVQKRKYGTNKTD
jgi:hypothetical protein